MIVVSDEELTADRTRFAYNSPSRQYLPPEPVPDGRRFLSYVWALHVVPNAYVFHLKESVSFNPAAAFREFVGIYSGTPVAVAQNEIPHLSFDLVAPDASGGYSRTGETKKVSFSSLLHGKAVAKVTKKPKEAERITALEQPLLLEDLIEEVPLV